MKAAQYGTAIRQLVRDTFRQARASGISIMMLIVTALCTLLCLSVTISGDVRLRAEDEPGYFMPAPQVRKLMLSVAGVLAASQPLEAASLSHAATLVWYSPEVNAALAKQEGVESVSGQMSMAFGAVTVPLGRERSDAVHLLELLLAGGVAGTLGVLLALVWTAGFMPTFLEPSAAAVLLAKPAPRWLLLVGKYLGVLAFVGVQVVLFIVLTWLALGLRTEVWDITYWWCIPLLLLQFTVFYSFSVLLAVMTRSTIACVFGAVLFWLLAWGINYAAIMARSTPESVPGATRTLAAAAYWITPKPIDAGWMLFNALDAKQHFEKPLVFQRLDAAPTFSPILSVISTLLIAGALLGLSAYELKAMDY